MPDPIPDTTLLAHFQAGDQEAFAALLARYHGLVRAACTRQAAPGEVDDCIQAVFLVLSRRPQSAVRAGNLPGWLLTTAWYVCRRTHRARARRQRAERVVAQEARECDIPREPEALAHLDECLRRLPEGQRTVITLHDLVGQSFDEIAGRLGLTRDHVYQLRHRGLGTIRQLLARRGFAVGATAVVSLLASQAQAASTTSPLLVATLCASPTPAATTLATGAMTAMTVATATPFAIAASLILATGIGTSVLTAEKTPGPVVPVTAANPAPPLATRDFLDQEVSLDFQDRDFRSALAEIGRKGGFTPSVAPGLNPGPITFKVEQMKVRYVLQFMGKLTNTDFTRTENSIRFTQTPPMLEVTPKPVGLSLTDMPADLRKNLDQWITVDLEDQNLSDTFVFLRKVTSLNIVLDPTVLTRPEHRINLKVEKMRLENVLAWVAETGSLNITWQEHALKISVGIHPEAQGPFPEALDVAALPAAIRSQMEQHLTLEFSDQPLSDVLLFLQRVSGMNLIVAPALLAGPGERPVTLAVQDLPLRDVLRRISTQAAVRMVYRDEALFIFDPKLIGKPAGAAPRKAPVKPTPKVEKVDF